MNRVLLSIVSGLLLVLAWPPIGLGLVFLFALVPMLVSVWDEERLKSFFIKVYLTHLVFAVGTMYWITLLPFRGTSGFTQIIGIALIPLFMSFPYLLLFFFKKKLNELIWWCFPFFWVAYEYLQLNWEVSFGWLHFGLALGKTNYLSAYYPYTGPLGGSFLLLFSNVLLSFIYRSERKKYYLVGFLGLLLFVSLFNLIKWTPSKEVYKKIAVIQPAIDPYKELNANSFYEQLNTFDSLISPFADSSLDLVVCSEGFFRGPFHDPLVLNNLDNHKIVVEFKSISKKIGAPLVLGFIGLEIIHDPLKHTTTTTRAENGLFYEYYNGVMLIAHDAPTQYTTKNKLVPFMERVPFLGVSKKLDVLRFSTNQMKGSYGFKKPQLLRYRDLHILGAVCMEVCFTEYLSRLAQKANLIALVSNDSWAGNSSGYLQNSAYTPSLALSAGKAVARSANGGESSFTLPNGKQFQQTEYNNREVIITRLPLLNDKTLYSKTGDFMGFISLFMVLLVAIYSVVHKK